MVNWGSVPSGAVLPFMFSSYDGGTGASITLTGLAVTDVEIYKGTSMTQRSSDAGVVLLDTDGIDLDGVTGIHGFSIDTGDNTDAGFYAVGSFFTVVVSAVTIDVQTVNFVAGTFRLLAAEAIAGKPKADVDAWLGTAAATPTVAGVPEVDVTHLGGATQSATDLKDFADDGYDPTTNKVQGVVLVDTLTTYTGNTVQTGDSFARIGLAGAGLTNIDLPNQTMDITGSLSGSVGSVTGAVGSVTGAVGSVTGAVGSVTGAVGSVTGAVGSVAGNVDGNVTGTVAGVTPSTAAQVAAVLTTAITESYRANGAAPTLAQFISEVLAHLGESAISGTTKTISKFDHVTAAETFTLDDASTPSSVTRAT